MSYDEGNYGSGSRGGYRGGFGGDRRSSYSGSSEPKPVKVGDEVEVKIEGTASKGDGIAKKDGFVIFVKTHGTPEYIEARRLLTFLDWFLPIETEWVPDNSILREFIGDSILKDFKVWGG